MFVLKTGRISYEVLDTFVVNYSSKTVNSVQQHFKCLLKFDCLEQMHNFKWVIITNIRV